MNLFIILLVIVTVFLLLIKLIASLVGRVSEHLLTSYFRDLEALLEHDKLPDDWSENVMNMARAGHVRRRFFHQLPWEKAAKQYLIKKIRRLHKFFETCPFIESPEARASLLEQLEAMTRRWEDSELPEILAYYNIRHYRNLTGRRGTKTGAVARRSGIKPRERASQARVENESRWQNRARDVVVEAQLAIRQNRELESELDRRIVPRSKVQAEIV